MLDGSFGVRTQLLKLLQALPTQDIQDHVGKALPYVRAGMTHLSRDIRNTAIDFLSFIINVSGLELVSSPGGWHQTLECFTTVLGWRSSSSKPSFSADPKSMARIMQVLAEFLQVGLIADKSRSIGHTTMATDFPLWQVPTLLVPTKSNAYGYLNLFGPPVQDDKQILDDYGDRMQNFAGNFQAAIWVGIEAARREGGELGRAAGMLTKTLEQAQHT